MFDRTRSKPSIDLSVGLHTALLPQGGMWRTGRLGLLSLVLITSTWMAGCASTHQHVNSTSSQDWQAPGATEFEAFAAAPVLLVGEQHDAAQHHRIQTDLVTWLTSRGSLAALVLEMAEQGNSTAGLPANASAAEVKSALGWVDAAWPWADYEGAIMAAVRAGVPVLGANLSRADLRAAMGQPTLESLLPESALREQDERMRIGHCGMLPERQIRPMTRMQIARDQAMAQTLARSLNQSLTQSLPPMGSVLLLAGHGHTDKTVGVPLHLKVPHRVLRFQAGPTPSGVADRSADTIWITPALPPTDYCAALRRPR
jgi:uncharacterized iron-regulated protein